MSAVKIFMALSFVLLGLAFYEMSGGADFEPEDHYAAEVETTETADQPTELALVEEAPARTGTTIRERLSTALVSPEVTQATLEPVDPPAAEPEVEISDAAAAVIAATFQTPVEEEPEQSTADILADLRQVAGSRVNMRAGPGTNFGVLVTLNGGTTAEVIDESLDAGGEPWVLVRVRDTGQEGWMAARLMTPVGG